MVSIKKINLKDLELCFELDSNTISMWSKSQWENEFKKKGIRIFGLFFSDIVIGICVFQVVIDEAQLNYFAISKNFRKKGFGTTLMNYSIKECKKLKLKKLLLEVSENNWRADKFYGNFDFLTVGIRKNYYSDGSNALLKEKKII